jgi:hypothetical protein
LIYDTLENHLPYAGSIDRAAVVPGMFLAWCANLGLLSAQFQQQHEALIVRVRYREIKGSELFVVAAAGVLDSDCLSDAGQSFCERYYASYLDDFRATFNSEPGDVEDNWHNYDSIARVLTRHHLGPLADTAPAEHGDGEKRWWQVWR